MKQFKKRAWGVFLLLFAFCMFWTSKPVRADYVEGSVKLLMFYADGNTGEQIEIKDEDLTVGVYRNQELLGTLERAAWMGDHTYWLNQGMDLKVQPGDSYGMAPQIPKGYVLDGIEVINYTGIPNTCVERHENIKWDGKKLSIRRTEDMPSTQDFWVKMYLKKAGEPSRLNGRCNICCDEYMYYTGKPQETDFHLTRNGLILTKDKDYTCTWSNNVNAGTPRVEINGKGKYSGKVVFDSYFSIYGADLYNKAKVTAKDAYYTGKPVEATFTVTVDGRKLTEGKDYTVNYPFEHTEIGECLAIIEGKGNYSGSVPVKFNIVKKTVSKKTASITGPHSSYKVTYGRKPFALNAAVTSKAKLTYKTSDKSVVSVSSSGTVTVAGPGYATITITSAETSKYKSAKKVIPVTVVPKTIATVKGDSPKSRTMNLTWSKDTKATGYRVYISRDKNFKTGVKAYTVTTPTKPALTASKLSAKGTWYVKIRSYKTAVVSGKKTNLYGAFSKVVSVKVK